MLKVQDQSVLQRVYHSFPIFTLIFLLLLGASDEGAGQTTTGPNYAETGVNVIGVGTVAWSNPGRVTANDNSYVTITLNNSASNYLQAKNFGFNIPINAVITGITVNIGRNRNGNGGNMYDAQVRLLKNGSVDGDNKAITGNNWPTSETAQSYGGTTDLWGTSWIASDINSSDFGVALAVTSTSSKTASVDYIQVSVTYIASGFWYKADTGVTGTTNVTVWADQSGNSNNALNSGIVSLVLNSINFNPSLTFSNVTRQFLTQASSVPLRFIIVNQPVGTNDLAGLIGVGPGSLTDKGIRQSNDASDSYTDQSWLGDNNGDDWAYSPGLSRINGASSFVHSFKWHIVNQSRNSSLPNSQYYLGGYYTGRPFTGKIAEVIAYNSSTNPSDAIIESYLAIKYGISLSDNYYASDGTTIWTSTSGYQNDIHGIGRDDVYGLDQRSSKSENPGTDILIIQSGSSFTTPSNAQTGTTLSTSRQFFIAGHNGGSTTVISLLSPGVNIIDRKWYAQVSGALSTESFQFNLTGANFGTNCKIGILIADDAAFSSNLRFVEGTLNSSTLTVNDAAITGNKYFTVATLKTPTAGTIGSGQTICSGDTPAIINSETDGTGFGVISYQWESSTDGLTWNPIAGETNSYYSPGVLIQTTQFRRKTAASLESVSCVSNPSNSITITVRTLPTVNITGNSLICVQGTTTLTPTTGGTWTSNNTSVATVTNEGIVTGVGNGATTFTFTNNTTGCSNTTSVVTVNTPSAPVIATVNQPTCDVSAGSVVLNGLPLSGAWTLTRNDGVTTTGTGSSTTLTNILSGTYTFTVTNEDLNTSCPGSGTGLLASYFSFNSGSRNYFSGEPSLIRIDPTVNFNWGTFGPGGGIGENYFAVRWEGKIQACYSETYSFRTRSDDGIRLWVNGTQIINNWDDHAAEYDIGTISLNAGQKYDIVLEFYEYGGDAVAQLEWSCPSQPTYQAIPSSQLYSVATGCTSASSASVTIDPQPTASTAPTSITGTSSICSGTTTTLTVSGGSLGIGASWNWYSGSCGGTFVGTGSSITVNPNTATTYFVRAEGTCNTTTCASSTVTVNPTPTLTSISVNPISACAGSDVTITVNGLISGSNTISYEYTIDGSTTSSSVNLTSSGGVASTILNNLPAGNYKVKINSITVNSCTTDFSTNNSVSWTINPEVTPTFAQIGPFCAGAPPVLLPGTSANGISGTWDPSIIITAAPGTTIYTFTPTTGQCATTTTMSVTVNSLPVVFSVNGGGTYCGSALAIGLNGSETGINYQLFRDGSTLVSTVAGTGSPISFIPQSDLGTYTVVANNSVTGCDVNMTGSAEISADTESPLASCKPGIFVSADINSCSATGVTLETPSATDNCGVASVTNNAPANFPIGNTIVIWTVTDHTGNTNTCTQTVTVNPNPVDIEVVDLGNSCQSGETGSQTSVEWTINKLSGVGNLTYYYEIRNGLTVVTNATKIVTGSSDSVSFTANNITNTSLNYTIVISGVTDDCGTTETNTANNSDSVTLFGVPDTSEIQTN